MFIHLLFFNEFSQWKKSHELTALWLKSKLPYTSLHRIFKRQLFTISCELFSFFSCIYSFSHLNSARKHVAIQPFFPLPRHKLNSSNAGDIHFTPLSYPPKLETDLQRRLVLHYKEKIATPEGPAVTRGDFLSGGKNMLFLLLGVLFVLRGVVCR